MRNLHLLADTYEIPQDSSSKRFYLAPVGGGCAPAPGHGPVLLCPKAAPRVLENDYPGFESEERHNDGPVIARLVVGTDAEVFPIEICPVYKAGGPGSGCWSRKNLSARFREEARGLYAEIQAVEE